jgi:ribulose-phosphate 3-epimerase
VHHELQRRFDETAPLAVNAGANVLVAGTAVFRGGPAVYADNIRALRGGG